MVTRSVVTSLRLTAPTDLLVRFDLLEVADAAVLDGPGLDLEAARVVAGGGIVEDLVVGVETWIGLVGTELVGGFDVGGEVAWDGANGGAQAG